MIPLDSGRPSLEWRPPQTATEGRRVPSRRRLRRDDAPPAAGLLFRGKYAVVRELGRGTFGRTWLAEHVHLERPVVLKELLPRWRGDPTARGALLREARILAALDHPRVARVLDVETAEGGWVIVMEHLGGGSLHAPAGARPVPVRRAARLIHEVLDGLAYAHEQGVVHRDVKPSNVLLDRDGHAKLADFGIALPLGEHGVRPARGTGAAGTPSFMAPEIARGEAGDARSDVYSVAATTIRVLSRAIVPGASADSTALEPWARDVPVRHASPPPGIPPPVLAWAMRGLAEDPDRRYGSAAEMRDALDAAVARCRADGR